MLRAVRPRCWGWGDPDVGCWLLSYCCWPRERDSCCSETMGCFGSVLEVEGQMSPSPPCSDSISTASTCCLLQQPLGHHDGGRGNLVTALSLLVRISFAQQGDPWLRAIEVPGASSHDGACWPAVMALLLLSFPVFPPPSGDV